MFVHVVLFWLKPNTPGAVAQEMQAECRDSLTKIPGVLHIWTGRPTGAGRPIVDNSYQVGLTVVFPDSATHDLYQDHPLHEAFIAKHGGHWAKVQVFDFVE